MVRQMYVLYLTIRTRWVEPGVTDLMQLAKLVVSFMRFPASNVFVLPANYRFRIPDNDSADSGGLRSWLDRNKHGRCIEGCWHKQPESRDADAAFHQLPGSRNRDAGWCEWGIAELCGSLSWAGLQSHCRYVVREVWFATPTRYPANQ